MRTSSRKSKRRPIWCWQWPSPCTSSSPSTRLSTAIAACTGLGSVHLSGVSSSRSTSCTSLSSLSSGWSSRAIITTTCSIQILVVPRTALWTVPASKPCPCCTGSPSSLGSNQDTAPKQTTISQDMWRSLVEWWLSARVSSWHLWDFTSHSSASSFFKICTSSLARSTSQIWRTVGVLRS